MSGNNALFKRMTAPPVEAIASTRVVLEFDCAASASINDVVFQNNTTEGLVEVNTNNTEVNPSIGVIISKTTTSRCKVLVLGVLAGYAGLNIGQKIWLSADGTVTSIKPTSGYLQTLGVAVASDSILYTPNAARVLQT